MGSERGPQLPDLHQARARRSEDISGMPRRGFGGGCHLGVHESGPVTYQQRQRPRRLETGFSCCRILEGEQ